MRALTSFDMYMWCFVLCVRLLHHHHHHHHQNTYHTIWSGFEPLDPSTLQLRTYEAFKSTLSAEYVSSYSCDRSTHTVVLLSVVRISCCAYWWHTVVQVCGSDKEVCSRSNMVHIQHHDKHESSNIFLSLVPEEEPVTRQYYLWTLPRLYRQTMRAPLSYCCCCCCCCCCAAFSYSVVGLISLASPHFGPLD